ncbi:hypothetical protein DFH09DRAFT_156067 [Mycena vulgaris]|nr:hypothetical protein DFH09DRAFT_156067 [Mycena vulgaris]
MAAVLPGFLIPLAKLLLFIIQEHLLEGFPFNSKLSPKKKSPANLATNFRWWQLGDAHHRRNVNFSRRHRKAPPDSGKLQKFKRRYSIG